MENDAPDGEAKAEGRLRRGPTSRGEEQQGAVSTNVGSVIVPGGERENQAKEKTPAYLIIQAKTCKNY